MSYRSINPEGIRRDPLESPSDVRTVDWWGVVFVIVVLLAFFSSIMFGWFYLRSGAETWPPEGTDRPEIILPSVSTVALLASCLPLIWLQRQLRGQANPRFNLGMGMSAALGVIFLAIQTISYLGLDFSATDHAYGSAFYTVIGFHTFLTLGGLYVGAIVQARAWKGHFSGSRHIAITNLATYWYAIVAMWLVVYASLYLLPYIE